MPEWCYKWCLKISPRRPASAVWRPIRCSPHTSASRAHLREISNQPFTSQHLYKEHNISPIQPLVMSGHTPRAPVVFKMFSRVDGNSTLLITAVACNLHVDSFCVITRARTRRWNRLKSSVRPRAAAAAAAALEALVQSNVSMHALPHDPSFIILTLATFLKWRKMLQSALPLVSENMCEWVRVCRACALSTACRR